LLDWLILANGKIKLNKKNSYYCLGFSYFIFDCLSYFIINFYFEYEIEKKIIKISNDELIINSLK
jgi:hypothetical protein